MRITTVPPEAACGRSAADYERRHAFLVFITNAADARPTPRPTHAADYERRNAFLVFITNAADARPTLRPTHCGRRMRPTHAADASE